MVKSDFSSDDCSYSQYGNDESLLAPKDNSIRRRLVFFRDFVWRKSKSFIALCRRHPISTFCFVVLVLAVITFMLLTCAATCILDSSYSVPVSKQNNDAPYGVIMFGDSLITGNHKQNFGLFPFMVAAIKSFLPHYNNLNFMNFGHGGDGIYAMRQRLTAILTTPADAVILLWDSDVSTNIETPETIDYLRQVYLSNLTYIISTIQQNKTGVQIAIAGPGILGEGPLFKRVFYDTYNERKIMLDEYSALNQRVAVAYNVTYIDLRTAYLEALPSYRLAYSGCLTIDGEHENENGLRIISKLIARTLHDWIDS